MNPEFSMSVVVQPDSPADSLCCTRTNLLLSLLALIASIVAEFTQQSVYFDSGFALDLR